MRAASAAWVKSLVRGVEHREHVSVNDELNEEDKQLDRAAYIFATLSGSSKGPSPLLYRVNISVEPHS